MGFSREPLAKCSAKGGSGGEAIEENPENDEWLDCAELNGIVELEVGKGRKECGNG